MGPTLDAATAELVRAALAEGLDPSKRSLERLGVDADPASALALAERWRPYRSFAMQYLWAMPAA